VAQAGFLNSISAVAVKEESCIAGTEVSADWFDCLCLGLGWPGGASVMSTPGRPRSSPGRWGTVLYAIDDWGRTLRLCLILLVLSVSPVTAVLLTHVLLQR
jgi:hypothetical protein